jgi:hypothetical protein
MTNEHPEDRAARLEGEEYSRKHGGEFCADHQVMLQMMISTYADKAAHDILDRLRELFWAGLWKPKSDRGTPAPCADCDDDLNGCPKHDL